MVTGLYAGLLGVVLFVLSVRVIGRRRAARIGLGDGGDGVLRRRIRAHANFVEYVPMILVLMALAELQGVAAPILHATGIALLAGRVAHAAGLGREPEPPALRVIGMALTFTALGLASTACLVAFLK